MSRSLPTFIPPMLAKLVEPFSDDGYFFEIKWDGIRALALVENGGLRLVSRRENPLTERYPELDVLASLPSGTAIDGEIVAMVNGAPDFHAVLQREQARNVHRIRALARSIPCVYVAFDLLYKDGKSTMNLPLTKRREALAETLAAAPSPQVILSDGVVGEGERFFREAVARELEGVVAKKLTSRYLPGRRTDAWRKIKRTQRIYCAVIGYLGEPGRDLRSLVVAVEEEGTLRYAGRVGSGLDERTARDLTKELRPLARPTPLVPVPSPVPSDATWVDPGVYCAVEFLEKTPNGELRAPRFVERVER